MTASSRLSHYMVLAALGTLVAAPLADAQPPAGTASPDPIGVWTIQDENASITSAKLSDRYYTNGLRLGYISGTNGVPEFLQGVGRTLWGDGQQRISFDISQQIYTPKDTETSFPAPGDRPYAGVLLGNLALTTDTADARSTLGLSLGVVGPWALGREIQNGFHDLIGQDHNNGWHTQLRNEPAIEVTTARTWRLPVAQLGRFEVDALPELDVGVGNVRVFAETGAVLRFGQGLASDYGVARVRPGISGGDAFTPTRPFAWYVFAGADGQAVAHDITLDGNTWRDSRHVTLKPFVGEFEGGLALMAFGARLTYTHVLQTQEFRHQKGGLHQFGSLALSVRF